MNNETKATHIFLSETENGTSVTRLRFYLNFDQNNEALIILA